MKNDSDFNFKEKSNSQGPILMYPSTKRHLCELMIPE